MADQRSFRELAHQAMHRIPGVPEHAEHQNATHHGSGRRHPVAHHDMSARPPRVLVAWQRRIAALFGQESR